MRGIKYFLQPCTGVNKLPENITYDPNFPDAYDRCLSLQVRVNVKRFTFSFNQSLARVGTLTWQSMWSVIWVNGCVIYQISWQESWVQNQQTQSKTPACLLLTALMTKKNESVPSAQSNARFYLLVRYILND